MWANIATQICALARSVLQVGRTLAALGVANNPKAEFGGLDRVVGLTRCHVGHPLRNSHRVISETLVEARKQRDINCCLNTMRPIWR